MHRCATGHDLRSQRLCAARTDSRLLIDQHNLTNNRRALSREEAKAQLRCSRRRAKKHRLPVQPTSY